MILDIFTLQGKSMDHKIYVFVISDHDNENLTKNLLESKNVYLAQKHVYVNN